MDLRHTNEGGTSTARSNDELLTIDEVAELVRTPVATLRYWRYLGQGPRGVRIGRHLRFWRTDVMCWLEQQT